MKIYHASVLTMLSFFACATPAKKLKLNRPMIPVAVAIPTAPPQIARSFPTPLIPSTPPLPLISLKSPSPIYAPLSQVKLLEFSEAFSMTHEIPIVKLNALKYLHLQLDFDVVALQASAVDTWLAMDTLLENKDEVRNIANAQSLVFPRFWQTTEMQNLIQYVDMHRFEQPLYLSGYLSDLGYASGYRNRFIMPLLAARLKSYGLLLPLEEVKLKLNPLMGLRECSSSNYPKNAAEELAVKASLQVLSEWITQVSPEVTHRYPTSPHGEMLRLLPISLQNNLNSCLQRRKDPKKMEAQNADLILKILDKISKNGHVFNWNAERSPKARSEILKQNLGKNYAVIGVFPINGDTLLEGSPPRTFMIPADKTELQTQFDKSLVESSYLETRNKPYFLNESLVWIEGARVPVTLGREYDGLILIPKVSAPHWSFQYLIQNTP